LLLIVYQAAKEENEFRTFDYNQSESNGIGWQG
jgi:hypothetical protein